MSEGLAQGAYIRGGYRAGFELTTLRTKLTKGVESTNETPRPSFSEWASSVSHAQRIIATINELVSMAQGCAMV